MKIFLRTFIIFFTMVKTVFSTPYDDLRFSLEDWESHTLRRQIAKDIGVHYSTLNSFMEKKGSTSPSVLSKYKKYITKEAACRVVPKEPICRDLTKDLEEVMNSSSEEDQRMVLRKKELKELKERIQGLLYAPSKIKALNTKIKSPGFSHILIPARGYADEKDAKGIFYDHFVFQRATKHETRVSIAEGQTFPFPSLKSYVKGNPHSLSFGEGWEGKKLPLRESLLEGSIGLLIIPGRTHDLEYDPVRAKHEIYLIREALKRGQPILSICAGAWRLWDAYRQLWNDPTYQKTVSEGLKEVKGHVYSRMMSFSETTGKIVYNIDMHEVRVEKNSFLASSLKGKKGKAEMSETFKVNSVHWKVVDAEKAPPFLKISAVSLPSKEGIEVPRLGTVFPEEKVPEAFESKNGAPLLGIQWHPEAYNPQDSTEIDHLNIIRYMVKAGDAYHHKCNMIKDLQRRYVAS